MVIGVARVRHLEYEASGLALRGTLAVPDGAGPFPGVLIGHEGPGLDDIQRARGSMISRSSATSGSPWTTTATTARSPIARQRRRLATRPVRRRATQLHPPTGVPGRHPRHRLQPARRHLQLASHGHPARRRPLTQNNGNRPDGCGHRAGAPLPSYPDSATRTFCTPRISSRRGQSESSLCQVVRFGGACRVSEPTGGGGRVGLACCRVRE